MRYRKVSWLQGEQEKKRSSRWGWIAQVLIISVFLGAFYVYGMQQQWKFVVYLYDFGFLALLLAVIWLYRGFDRRIPEPEDLPESWSAAKKEKYIERRHKDQALGRRLTAVLLPLSVILMIDVIYLAVTAK